MQLGIKVEKLGDLILWNPFVWQFWGENLWSRYSSYKELYVCEISWELGKDLESCWCSAKI